MDMYHRVITPKSGRLPRWPKLIWNVETFAPDRRSRKRAREEITTALDDNGETEGSILSTSTDNTSQATPSDIEEIERGQPNPKRAKITCEFAELVREEDTYLTLDQLEATYDAVKEIRLRLGRKENPDSNDFDADRPRPRPRLKGDILGNVVMHFARCFGPQGEAQLRKMISAGSITDAAFSQNINESTIAQEARAVLEELQKDAQTEKTDLRNRHQRMTGLARLSKNFHHLVDQYQKEGSSVNRKMTALGLKESQGRDARSLAYAYLLHLTLGYDPIEALTKNPKRKPRGTKIRRLTDKDEVPDAERQKMFDHKEGLRKKIQTGDTYLKIAETLGPSMYALLPELTMRYYHNKCSNHLLEDVLDGLVQAVPHLPKFCQRIQSEIIDKIGDDQAFSRVTIERESESGEAYGLQALMESSKVTGTITQPNGTPERPSTSDTSAVDTNSGRRSTRALPSRRRKLRK